MKHDPWSTWILRHTPWWLMYFSRNFNTLSDVLVVVTMAYGHLENLSVVTKTYFFCFLKSLIGPQKTNCIHSLGSGTFLISSLGSYGFEFLPHPCIIDIRSFLPPDCGTYRGTKHTEQPRTCSVFHDGRSGSVTLPVFAVVMGLLVVRPARHRCLLGRGRWHTEPIIFPPS